MENIKGVIETYLNEDNMLIIIIVISVLIITIIGYFADKANKKLKNISNEETVELNKEKKEKKKKKKKEETEEKKETIEEPVIDNNSTTVIDSFNQQTVIEEPITEINDISMISDVALEEELTTESINIEPAPIPELDLSKSDVAGPNLFGDESNIDINNEDEDPLRDFEKLGEALFIKQNTIEEENKTDSEELELISDDTE